MEINNQLDNMFCKQYYFVDLEQRGILQILEEFIKNNVANEMKYYFCEL